MKIRGLLLKDIFELWAQCRVQLVLTGVYLLLPLFASVGMMLLAKKKPTLFHAELHHQRKRDEKIDDGRRCRNGERGEKLAPPGKKGGKRLYCRAERDGDHTEQKPAPEEVALPHRHGERVPFPPAALVIAERIDRHHLLLTMAFMLLSGALA